MDEVVNTEVFMFKIRIQRVAARLAKASTLEEVKDLLDVLAENREALAELELRLEREYA